MEKPALFSVYPLRSGMPALLAGSIPGLAACIPGYALARPPANALSTPSGKSAMKIRLTVDGKSATAALYDNATAHDFAALPPLSLTMEDYDTIERVSKLPRKLSTQGALDGVAPVAGELTRYVPWGNLALFVNDGSYSSNLLPLGKVNEGLPVLAQPGPYKVRIERILD